MLGEKCNMNVSDSIQSSGWINLPGIAWFNSVVLWVAANEEVPCLSLSPVSSFSSQQSLWAGSSISCLHYLAVSWAFYFLSQLLFPEESAVVMNLLQDTTHDLITPLRSLKGNSTHLEEAFGYFGSFLQSDQFCCMIW